MVKIVVSVSCAVSAVSLLLLAVATIGSRPPSTPPGPWQPIFATPPAAFQTADRPLEEAELEDIASIRRSLGMARDGDEDAFLGALRSVPEQDAPEDIAAAAFSPDNVAPAIWADESPEGDFEIPFSEPAALPKPSLPEALLAAADALNDRADRLENFDDERAAGRLRRLARRLRRTAKIETAQAAGVTMDR